MKNNKYAIVRVQEKCPSGWNLEPSFCDKKCKTCKVAENYGDTKEQLVKKVEQVLKRETENDGIVIPFKKSVLWNEVAEKIIEFLGVRE